MLERGSSEVIPRACFYFTFACLLLVVVEDPEAMNERRLMIFQPLCTLFLVNMGLEL